VSQNYFSYRFDVPALYVCISLERQSARMSEILIVAYLDGKLWPVDTSALKGQKGEGDGSPKANFCIRPWSCVMW